MSRRVQAVLAALLLGAGAAAVWRRPVAALYAFVVGLALHNAVGAGLYGLGLRGAPLTAVEAWKEVLLGVALLRVGADALRRRRLPFRPGVVDALALAFGAIVVVYGLLPQSLLDGNAGPKAILLGLKHDLVPVGAYFLGRSLALERRDLVRLASTVLVAAAAVAAVRPLEGYAGAIRR